MAKKKSSKRAAKPAVEEPQVEQPEIEEEEMTLGESEAMAQSGMDKRQRDRIQSAKAKKKFAAIRLGQVPVPEGSNADQSPCQVDMGKYIMKVNQREYGPGVITVPRHLGDQLVSMVYAAKTKEGEIFTGKTFRVEKQGGKMIKTETSSLELNKAKPSHTL